MKKPYLSIFSIILFHCISWSQAGTLDTGFGNNGIVIIQDELPASVESVSIEADKQNRIVIATRENKDTIFRMSRYLIDGSPDLSFGQNGEIVIAENGKRSVSSIKCTRDNKIVITGNANRPHDSIRWSYDYDIFVARYLENGQPDSTFGINGFVLIQVDTNIYSFDIAVLDDGKILVTGYYGWIGWCVCNTDVLLIRLLEDGALDSSFGEEGFSIVDATIDEPNVDIGTVVQVQADQKIIVSGINGSSFGHSRFILIRYLPDGRLDTSFGINGIVVAEANTPNYYAIFIKEDGSVLLAGNEGQVFTGGISAVLRQLTKDGKADTSFADNGAYISLPDDNGRTFYDVNVQPDGKIVTAGRWVDPGYWLGYAWLMRFNPDGTPDPTFGMDGMALVKMENYITGFTRLYFEPENKITAVGFNVDPSDGIFKQLYIARFNNDKSNSIQEKYTGEDLLVFPNPASEWILVQSKNENTPPGSVIRILDTCGKVLFEKTMVENPEKIATDNFNAGLYFMEYTNRLQKVTKKVIITR